MRHFVHFSKDSIAQILMNGLEAFVIKHKNKNRSGIEMFGSIFGSMESTSTTRHYNIKFLSVDTSADMNAGYVIPEFCTQFLKEEIAKSMDYVHFGQIHTHPYLDYEMTLDQLRDIGCRFSDEDLRYFASDLLGREGSVVQIILAIRNQERKSHIKDGNIDDNTFEFAVGKCKCFIHAQVFSLDEQGELIFEPTILKCDYLQNFEHMITDFPAIEKEKGKKRILKPKF